MAKFQGTDSYYLTKKLNHLFWRGMALVALVVIAGGISLALRNSFQDNTSGVLLFAVVFLGLLFLVNSLAKSTETEYDKYDSGIRGEYQIAKILQRLPHQFTVFQDLVISEHGNIDFVVVGPTGVFAIEAKSHKGKIGYDGWQLTRNGRPFEKDFLRQATNESFAVHNYIKSVTGNDIFVKPVLTFSSERAFLNFAPKAIQGHVRVVNRFYLNKLVESDPTYFYHPEVREKIEAALKDKLAARPART